MNNEHNPVVLLNGEVWHVVEDGRRVDTALCGQKLTNRRTHTRLKRVGIERICAQCRQLWLAEMA